MTSTFRRAWRFNTVLVVALTALVSTALTSTTSRTALGSEPTPAPAPDCGAPLLKADGSAWSCTFADEFSGTTLDLTKWSAMTTQATGTGFPECRLDDPDNISVAGGFLKLTVRKELLPVLCPGLIRPFATYYTAGAVTTARKFAQTYGRFEVRAKFPDADKPGLHSALWMWPEDNRHSDGQGEIDLAEYRTSVLDTIVPTLHYTQDGDGQEVTSWKCMVDDAGGRFHVYAVEWTAAQISFWYDGQLCLRNAGWRAKGLPAPQPFDQPYWFILNQSLNFNNDLDQPLNSPLPASMYVDYVHIWK